MISHKETFLQGERPAFIIKPMKLQDRLKQARKHAGLSQDQLAKQVGIKQASVSEIERGISKTSGYLVKMASACGVNPTWLSEGIGEMLGTRPTGSNLQSEITIFGEVDPWDDATPLEPDEVELPLFREVELAAGDGRTQVIENGGAKLRFSRRTLSKANIQKEYAALAYVSGSSMEPALMDGSVIGINKNDRTIKDGKVYALDHDGMLRVKQVFRMPGGGIRLRSFNNIEFPDEEYGPGWPETIGIIGRIFWSSTMW